MQRTRAQEAITIRVAFGDSPGLQALQDVVVTDPVVQRLAALVGCGAIHEHSVMYQGLERTMQVIFGGSSSVQGVPVPLEVYISFLFWLFNSYYCVRVSYFCFLVFPQLSSFEDQLAYLGSRQLMDYLAGDRSILSDSSSTVFERSDACNWLHCGDKRSRDRFKPVGPFGGLDLRFILALLRGEKNKTRNDVITFSFFF